MASPSIKQQYVVTAYDDTDSDALDRRMAARPAHFEGARRLKAQGSFIEGGAMLDDSGNMIGSVMIVAFDSRQQLDEWLEVEPYVTGNVWQRIEVKPFRVAQL